MELTPTQQWEIVRRADEAGAFASVLDAVDGRATSTLRPTIRALLVRLTEILGEEPFDPKTLVRTLVLNSRGWARGAFAGLGHDFERVVEDELTLVRLIAIAGIDVGGDE